jgi:hypothetical protein
MRVQLPPIIPAKDMGIINFAISMLCRCASVGTILTNNITTAVVLMNAEQPPTTNIIQGTENNKGSLNNGIIISANSPIVPFFSKADVIIINANIVTTAGLLKPETASSGDTNPNSNKDTNTKKATLSTGKVSVINSKVEIPSITNNIMISNVNIYTILSAVNEISTKL